MIPPGPPHLAGRRLSRAQRPSFDSLLLSGRRAGRGGRALRRMWEGKAERRVFRKTACGLHPQCERVLPDPLTQADCFPPARKTVIKEGIKKIRVYARQFSHNNLMFLPYPPFFPEYTAWQACRHQRIEKTVFFRGKKQNNVLKNRLFCMQKPDCLLNKALSSANRGLPER